MPLRSDHFTKPPNSRLEGCLLNDPQHVTPGNSGEHVRLIQIALGKLLPTFLVIDGKYGPNTAAAVVDYKNQRGILRKGQLSADNIVGKQTIKSLDDEMVEQEKLQRLPSRFVCMTEEGHNHDHSKCPQAPSIQFERVEHRGTPLNPQGNVRVNIGGEGETLHLGFDDCITDTRSLFGPIGRTLTQDLATNSVTDLCSRSSPITTEAIENGQGEREISRIAAPGCRFTYANNVGRTTAQLPFLLSLGSIIEDIMVPSTNSKLEGLRAIVVIMRGDGRFTPRIPTGRRNR